MIRDRFHLLRDSIFDERNRLGREHLSERRVGAGQVTQSITDKLANGVFKRLIVHQVVKSALRELQNLFECLFANRFIEPLLQNSIDLPVDKLFDRLSRLFALQN